MDSRRQHQHQHGALSCICGRPAAGISAYPRLCHAKPLHRAGGGDRLRIALSADQCFPCRGKYGCGNDSLHRAAFFLHRRRGVSGRCAVDYFHNQGVPAGQSGGISKRKVRTQGHRRERARNPVLNSRDAPHHAATLLGADLHLDGAVLHVALLSGGCGAQCFWSCRHGFSAVFRGSGVGGHLFRNVLVGVFRIFLRAACTCAAVRPQGNPHVLPGMRRPGIAFRGRDSQ